MRVVAATMSSALMIALAANAGGPWTGLAWLAFAPWFAVQRCIPLRWSFAAGMAMGMLYIVPGHWALFHDAIATGYAAAWKQHLLTVGLFALWAVPFALWCWINAQWLDHAAIPRWARPICASGVLSTLICLVGGVFPYTPAIMLSDQRPMIQILELGGEPLLLWLLLWPSAALGEVLAAWRNPGAWHVVVPPAAAVLIVGLWGTWRIEQLEAMSESPASQRLAVAPLQLDLPMRSGHATILRGPGSARGLSAAALEAAPQCELVLWPELPVDDRASQVVCEQMRARPLDRPLLLQCLRPAEGYDGAQSVTAELVDGTKPLTPRHAKSALIPGFERALWSDGGFVKGEPGTTFAFDATRRLIPALCYELHHRVHLRRASLAGGNFVLHMASFAPFGPHGIDRLDTAMAQMRAVEYRLPIVRAANRGSVGWIDVTGRNHRTGERFGRGASCISAVSPAVGPTVLAYLGDWAIALPAGVALLLCLVFGGREARARRRVEFPLQVSR